MIISNLCPLRILEKKHAEITEVELANRVFKMHLYYSEPSCPKAALNEGQYMYKKQVPIIAITFE